MLKSVWKFKQNMAKSHKTCMEQAEIIDTFGTYHVLVGKQSYLLCVQVQVKLATSVVIGAIVHFTTFLYLLESYWSTLNLSMFAKGNLLLRYISPSTWGNQREVRELSSPYHLTMGFADANPRQTISRLRFLNSS